MYHPIMFHILYSTYDYVSIFRFVNLYLEQNTITLMIISLTALKFLT